LIKAAPGSISALVAPSALMNERRRKRLVAICSETGPADDVGSVEVRFELIGVLIVTSSEDKIELAVNGVRSKYSAALLIHEDYELTSLFPIA
jgi:hypothetical protein